MGAAGEGGWRTGSGARVAEGDRVAEPPHPFEAERFAGGLGEIEGPALDVGAAVDHLGDDRVAVVDELDRGSTRQRLVRDAERVPAQGRATSGFVAPEPGAVPAGAGVAEGAEGKVGPWCGRRARGAAGRG